MDNFDTKYHRPWQWFLLRPRHFLMDEWHMWHTEDGEFRYYESGDYLNWEHCMTWAKEFMTHLPWAPVSHTSYWAELRWRIRYQNWMNNLAHADPHTVR